MSAACNSAVTIRYERQATLELYRWSIKTVQQRGNAAFRGVLCVEYKIPCTQNYLFEIQSTKLVHNSPATSADVNTAGSSLHFINKRHTNLVLKNGDLAIVRMRQYDIVLYFKITTSSSSWMSEENHKNVKSKQTGFQPSTSEALVRLGAANFLH